MVPENDKDPLDNTEEVEQELRKIFVFISGTRRIGESILHTEPGRIQSVTVNLYYGRMAQIADMISNLSAERGRIRPSRVKNLKISYEGLELLASEMADRLDASYNVPSIDWSILGWSEPAGTTFTEEAPLFLKLEYEPTEEEDERVLLDRRPAMKYNEPSSTRATSASLEQGTVFSTADKIICGFMATITIAVIAFLWSLQSTNAEAMRAITKEMGEAHMQLYQQMDEMSDENREHNQKMLDAVKDALKD